MAKTTAETSLKIARFWIVNTGELTCRLAAYRLPLANNESSREIQTISCPEQEAWEHVQPLDPQLLKFSYDYFPRGRLDFFPSGRRWLLSVAPRLNETQIINFLADEWHLPKGHLTVSTDDRYVSAYNGPIVLRNFLI